jgi:hypothetical protein
MINKLFFIIFVVILIPIISVYGQQTTASIIILTDHQISFDNDVIVLSPTESLDLSSLNSTAPVNSTQTIGTLTINLTQEITFVANDNVVIVLKNTELTTTSVEIPNQTTISGPKEWNNTIAPPTKIPVTGDIPSGFQTPDSVIQIGSPDVVLIFNKSVTIILKDVTGQTAYKLPGEDTWNLIDDCRGTYSKPDDPGFPNECSISDDTDTKIVTYHFTEFAEFEEIIKETTKTSSSSSGGSHGSRISPPNSGFSGKIKSSNVLPVWLTQPVLWWNSDQITAQEFSSIMGWLIDENIIKIEDKTKPEKQIITMAPSTKHLFSLWEKGGVSESTILNIVEKYREYGIW